MGKRIDDKQEKISMIKAKALCRVPFLYRLRASRTRLELLKRKFFLDLSKNEAMFGQVSR